MQMPTPSSKRFEALVTDLTDKYRHNPYVQTTVHIILLQVILTILTVAIFGWGIQYSQTRTVGSISQHITAVQNGSTTQMQTLPESIADVRSKTIWYVFWCLLFLTTIFGFLAARFALRPTRNSLQFQKRFIGNVAHEIRTPLAIIKTSTEVALMDPEVDDEMRTTLNETIVELDRISETINNLLSFDNLIHPGKVKSEPLDLVPIVRTVIGRHETLAKTRGITLSAQTPGTEYRIMGNAVALDQVITNLVKNALNYTPQNKNGSVVVKLDIDYRGRVLLSVIDTGIGIAQKDLYHVFEPFYRAESSRVRGVGSGTSGLGLAIVNEIVRLHRGTITVRSAVGKGTTIELSFPRAEEAVTHPIPDVDADEVHEITLNLS
ncbi:MAG: Two-component system, OmpR family, sensor histidine kinase CiaH [Parcubacteria group bacterium]|nr:Two-component system, OmpR family, sensor histidine kinase CiaH [Parcubacteria group bacterium]